MASTIDNRGHLHGGLLVRPPCYPFKLPMRNPDAPKFLRPSPLALKSLSVLRWGVSQVRPVTLIPGKEGFDLMVKCGEGKMHREPILESPERVIAFPPYAPRRIPARSARSPITGAIRLSPSVSFADAL